jgi:hypothetical protein
MPAQDWIEALIREKPKRLMHNQLVIQISLVLMIIPALQLAGLGFWLVFNPYPIVVVPGILVAWIIASVTYAALRLHAARQNKREM